MSLFKDRFDEKTYNNGPACSIALFDTEVIKASEITIPADLFSRIMHLGEAYDLHYTALFGESGYQLVEVVNGEHHTKITECVYGGISVV